MGGGCKFYFQVTSIFMLLETFDLNILHKNVTEPVQPPEALSSLNGDWWKSHTKVHTMNQITITANGAVADCLQIYHLWSPDCILSGHWELLILSHPLSCSLWNGVISSHIGRKHSFADYPIWITFLPLWSSITTVLASFFKQAMVVIHFFGGLPDIKQCCI